MGVRVLWALTAGFLLGVFVRSFVPLGDAFAWLCVVLALACIAYSFADARRSAALILAAVAFAAFGGGMVRMESAILVNEPALDARIGEKTVIEGIVSAAPDIRENQVRVMIHVTSVLSSTASARVLAALPPHTPIYYGERVRVSGVVHRPESFHSGEGREFDYPGYLAAQGVLYQLDFAQLESKSGSAANPVVASALQVRDLFLSGLQRSLPEPQSGLAGGITVGDKRAMGKDLTEEFRIVSLVHIVVLSGYNITIVIYWLFRFLDFLHVPRGVRLGMGAVVAMFFVVITGFASAGLRAALMAMISITGSWSGRIYRPGRALALVAVAMVAWNPYLLVFDPGFQLSFLATAGLITFSPLFEKWYARIPESWTLREILVSSSSAQIAVLPLLLFQSGMLSLVSLFANLLALIVVAPAMLMVCVAAVGGIIAGQLAPIVGFPAYVLLSYILGVAHIFASLPFAAVSIGAFSAWLLLPIYACMFGFGIARMQKGAAPEGAARGIL